MTTTRKLWLGFGSLTALLVVICVAILVRVRALDAQVADMTEAQQRGEAARELEISVVGFALAVSDFLRNGEPKFKTEAEAKARGVEKCRAEYEKRVDTERHREIAARFADEWGQLHTLGQSLLAAPRPAPAADVARFGELRFRLEAFLDDQQQRQAEAEFDARYQTIQLTTRNIVRFVVILLACGTVLAIGTSVGVGRAVVRDERATAEQGGRLRLSEERFRTLFETMDEGFCVVEVAFDPAGRAVDYRHLEMNPAFEKQTGMRGLLGKSVRAAIPDLEEFWYEAYGRVAATGEPTQFTHEARPLGRWFDVSAFRLGGADSRKVAVLFNDITARKRAEDDRERLVGELRDQDHRKDVFLATLAHELRNPLAPIRNALQVLRMSDTPDARDKAQALMERQLGQMVRLVDDLLDISRVSRGKMDLKPVRVTLDAVVSSAVETSRPLIEKMGHALTVALPDRPVYLDADPTRLAQVFLNLLNNAAKYSDRGGRITLAAARDGDGVVVSVKDTGIGIAADQLPRVFELFSQVDQSLEKAQGGLGIGLTLVRRLVEMHGGTVEARSDGVGRGSEFVVRLPAASAAAPPADAAKPAPPARSALRILIVDDNRDGADSLSDMLAILGNETRTEYDGEAAVAAAAEFRPDVILLDIGLPKLNGYDACRRIREQQGPTPPVIIAQTGWGAEEDRQKTRDAGFDHHLVKPVESAALLKLLAGSKSGKD